jgi:hypothetical protein
MTALATDPRTGGLRVPVDDLAKYAGLTALASAVLAAAGILSTLAYLSAWAVPAPLVRFDPLTAALRSETVVYQFVLLAGIVGSLHWLARRVDGQRRGSGILATLGAGMIVFLAVQTIVTGYVGPAITLIGGLSLFLVHRRGLVRDRSAALLFALIALLSAYQTGTESGRLVRDDPAWQTDVVMTSRTAVGGLAGTEVGGGWHYEGLYLVFRDGEAVYVARRGDDHRVWIVPAGNVMALGIAQ